MDCIRIEGIEANAIIGTLPEERTSPQKLIVTAELRGDFRAAGKTDDFTLTFDYSAMEKRIAYFVASSQYFLLEALGEHLAADILKTPHVSSVRLQIRKPAAAKIAKGIVLDIERCKEKEKNA